MKNSQKILLGIVVTTLSMIMVSLAIQSLLLTPKLPTIPIHEQIKIKADSVAVGSAVQPDTAKLRKLQELKIRIATARYNDSVQRAKNQRR
ncbi:hypothetical protein DTQ70_03895 [Runella sp. SP2]|nr:hypothetical protein DTQ70_03895 [Runella sp. SP2]